MHGATIKTVTVHHAVFILNVKGFTEKFKCIESHYNIKTVFRMKHTFGMSLMRTRPEGKFCL
jgi:hypothetical protein